MPELPEVETVKNVLLPIIKNRTILSVDILRKSIIHSDLMDFSNKLKGQTFLNITRYGKFLFIHLTNDLVIISHLRMEGKYYEMNEEDNNSKYARVVFHLDNNHKLCYDDSRCFGLMILTDEKHYKDIKDVSSLGKEPFDIKDINYLLNRCNNSSLPIKSTLLDQTLITGLGNIYADEVLFASKIHPLTPANKINKKEWEEIINNSIKILNKAIEEGGSTIKSYHPGKDIDGNFQLSIKAYGKKGTPCPNCSSIFRFMKVNGRGTTYCPKCQKLLKKNIRVAIYGKIASGKSTVLSIFKENNIVTASSDAIVNKLYNDPKVAKQIGELFNLPFENKVDKNILRSYIKDNPKDKKKLEKVVHPLVKNEILRIFKENDKGIVAIEVPLLYESKMDNLFDVIIAIDIPLNKQIELLKNRNSLSADDLLLINANHKFDENKIKADYIISNKTSVDSLKKQVVEIINKLQGLLG